MDCDVNVLTLPNKDESIMIHLDIRLFFQSSLKSVSVSEISSFRLFCRKRAAACGRLEGSTSPKRRVASTQMSLYTWDTSSSENGGAAGVSFLALSGVNLPLKTYLTRILMTMTPKVIINAPWGTRECVIFPLLLPLSLMCPLPLLANTWETPSPACQQLGVE